jgi:hypothetical protein
MANKHSERATLNSNPQIEEISVCLPVLPSTLKMEAVRSFEIWVNPYQTARRHIPVTAVGSSYLV